MHITVIIIIIHFIQLLLHCYYQKQLYTSKTSDGFVAFFQPVFQRFITQLHLYVQQEPQ